ncbi:elongin A%2C like [Scomber scombrus]|uniref:Elongin A, like n=1 Tax=Scomber scombrus TaxID=13677 RepID=A0AAV1MX10_SCOSC|nr:elongin A, like [Scomber scombrus]
MARRSDVVKKVLRFKLQLTDTEESATVLKTLQKLKDLDITLDILAETGIGKTVNSLRRHEEAGEFAKSLVRGWKKLVPKNPTSVTEDRTMSDSMSVKDKLDDQNCPNAEGLTIEDLNNNCFTSHGKSRETNEPLFKMGKRKADAEKRCEEQKRKKDQNEFQNILESDEILSKKTKIQIQDHSKERNNYDDNNCDSVLGNKNAVDTIQKSRPDSKEKLESSSDCEGFGSEKESNKRSKPSEESLKDGKESFSYDSSDKYSKKLFKLAHVEDDRSSGISSSSEAQNRKKKKKEKEKHSSHKRKESEYAGHSKPQNKKTRRTHKDKKNDSEEPSMSFESCLNYDGNVSKRRERSGAKKTPKKIKKKVKEDLGVKPVKSSVKSLNALSSKKSVMDWINIPLPAVLPECENPTSVEYFERKVVEKDFDFCDMPEESAGFTGQRLNKKMQVYSGAKTIFLPAMMSLYQQCIRTLQNNINLLHETGGVPFDILEPVLERCTPEQLLRVEECNPIYVGVTDHLWGKHCQRDFKDYKLQEYESWKEMFIRLSDEREVKLQRLTKSIVSAHSNKPKGRQVKMAFIHTVAKPPRDVRIQQEIHGTAVQQPHQLRCSAKVQDNRSKPSSEPTRSSSTSSGASSTQDARKKTRVAPMMAKSLKAFKKQLGRR